MLFSVGGKSPSIGSHYCHFIHKKEIQRRDFSFMCMLCDPEAKTRRAWSKIDCAEATLFTCITYTCRTHPTRCCVSCFIPRLDPLFSLSVCTLPCSSADREAPSVLHCEQGWMAMEGVLPLPGNKARCHWHCKSQ